ncbi:hypothetical protein M0812_06930 [Anaeramoeba flamelloides]|uniref:PAS domain-containing protein n=1 Tax=Anaeramoeba flamelloides TaxID=1746091 RepID=A0AAV8AEY1_9EUKA|nr:hypothetical protein M0812_06930 [Anaeramoeba flamelloides]
MGNKQISSTHPDFKNYLKIIKKTNKPFILLQSNGEVIFANSATFQLLQIPKKIKDRSKYTLTKLSPDVQPHVNVKTVPYFKKYFTAMLTKKAGQENFMWNYKPTNGKEKWAKVTMTRFKFGNDIIVQVFLEEKTDITQIYESEGNIDNSTDEQSSEENLPIQKSQASTEVDNFSDNNSTAHVDTNTTKIREKITIINKLLIGAVEPKNDGDNIELKIKKNNQKVSCNQYKKTHSRKKSKEQKKINSQLLKLTQLHLDTMQYKEHRKQLLMDRIQDGNEIIQLEMVKLENQLSRRREGQDNETNQIQNLKKEISEIKKKIFKIKEIIQKFNENTKENENDKNPFDHLLLKIEDLVDFEFNK